MKHTQLLFKDAARAKVLAGATVLADAVRVTLGPKSKSVLIEKKFGTPLVCNDGVTIVKEIHLEDGDENLGAQMLREAAVRTSDDVGDGTTTATVLAHAIYSEGLRNIVAGSSAIDVKRGLPRRSLCRSASGHLTAPLQRGYPVHNHAGVRSAGWRLRRSLRRVTTYGSCHSPGETATRGSGQHHT